MATAEDIHLGYYNDILLPPSIRGKFKHSGKTEHLQEKERSTLASPNQARQQLPDLPYAITLSRTLVGLLITVGWEIRGLGPEPKNPAVLESYRRDMVKYCKDPNRFGDWDEGLEVTVNCKFSSLDSTLRKNVDLTMVVLRCCYELPPLSLGPGRIYKERQAVLRSRHELVDYESRAPRKLLEKNWKVCPNGTLPHQKLNIFVVNLDIPGKHLLRDAEVIFTTQEREI
ncbi:hypothetical protein CC80DRAFT_507699 [Byssothecium circinans]|uniref:Uncharacterized protein n=1 Tax=Byssothecium circinans TaxID=147558 RepID=A0A6A5TVI9_9PLEO|nr:hypothetical protein CC80DRAFT_507699 [Byssothecium circinans]